MRLSLERHEISTSEPLYNMVLDITRISVGLQMPIKDLLKTYNMVWIANTEIGLELNNGILSKLF